MRSNSGPTKRSSQGAAAPWRRACPRATPARRPALASAPRATRGSLLPMRRTPRLLGVLPEPRAPRRVVPAWGWPRPPVRRQHPAVRAPAEVAVLRRYLRRHRDVTGGASPIKTECPALLAPSLSLHRARHCRPPVNLPPCPSPVRLTFLAYSLNALETCADIRCPAFPHPRRSRSPPRAPPPAGATRPHRRCPRSNYGLPRALGELVVVPHRLPGRERGRLAEFSWRRRLPCPRPQLQGPLSF
jgi:hypothetical protein